MSAPTPFRIDAPLRALCALLLVSVLAAAAARWSGIGVQQLPQAAVLQQRELRFEDLPDGGIAVFDAAHPAQPLDRIAPASHGFLRGSLRGLARERKRQGGDARQPFRLQARADGALSLEDPVTGRRIDLRSFGASNAAVFAQWLPRPDRP